MKIASLSLLQKAKSKPLRHGDTEIKKLRDSVSPWLDTPGELAVSPFQPFPCPVRASIVANLWVGYLAQVTTVSSKRMYVILPKDTGTV